MCALITRPVNAAESRSSPNLFVRDALREPHPRLNVRRWPPALLFDEPLLDLGEGTLATCAVTYLNVT